MSALKILVTGAVGSGKTTFVASLSDIEPVNTDVESKETEGKSHTTVGLDYGSTTVGGQAVRLFGTPGQERFSYMWDVLGEGVDGGVLLIDASNESAVSETEALLKTLLPDGESAPIVVGVTHTDVSPNHVDQVRTAPFTRRVAWMGDVDARDSEDGRVLVDKLIEQVA